MRKFHVGTIQAGPYREIGVAFSEAGLIHTHMFLDQEGEFYQRMVGHFPGQVHPADERVEAALEQIQDYLAGRLREFEILIDWSGADMTDFQRKVLRATLAIPYGQTRSYGEIAGLIGKPRAARAVGQAEAHNPMPLIIPCHRVIGSRGEMVGYGGPEGVDQKAWLLELERQQA